MKKYLFFATIFAFTAMMFAQIGVGVFAGYDNNWVEIDGNHTSPVGDLSFGANYTYGQELGDGTLRFVPELRFTLGSFTQDGDDYPLNILNIDGKVLYDYPIIENFFVTPYVGWEFGLNLSYDKKKPGTDYFGWDNETAFNAVFGAGLAYDIPVEPMVFTPYLDFGMRYLTDAEDIGSIEVNALRMNLSLGVDTTFIDMITLGLDYTMGLNETFKDTKIKEHSWSARVTYNF